MHKTLAVFTLILFLFAGCKKDDLPSEGESAIKSYDFSVVGGAKTNDNGFITYCKERIFIDNLINSPLNRKIIKINSDGSIGWKYDFKPAIVNITNYSWVNIGGICTVSDGYVAVAMQITQDTSFLKGIKFDLSGQKVFEKRIDNFTSISVYSENILPLTNGNVLIGANVYDQSASSYFYYLYLISSTGDTLWTKKNFKTTGFINKMIEASSGNFIFVGSYTDPNNYLSYGYVASFQSDGTFIAERHYRFPPPNSWENNYTNVIESNNNFLITGFADVGENVTYQYNYTAAVVNQNLDTLWMKNMSNPKQDFCFSSVATNDGNFILFGISTYNQFPQADYASSMLAIKIDKNGNEIYRKNLAEKQSAKGLLINQNADNSFNILGTKFAYGNQDVGHSIFMHVKLD